MVSVVVIGGGVGGMTAAQELVERGYSVTLCDASSGFGGKAKSQPVTGSGTAGRRDLPGEHGFRFYPRFYKHVTDTMQRIPTSNGRTVADNLRPTTESAIAGIDDDTWYRFSRKQLSSPMDVIETLELFFQQLDFDPADVALFSVKFLQFFASGDARRLGEYENMSWYTFAQGDAYSLKFRRQLRAIPRTMVAMDPIIGSANTIGVASMQLVLDYATSGVTNDRTMGGPTSEMWLDHWVTHLRNLGVMMIANQRCEQINVSGGTISGVKFSDGTVRTADYYVLAVPIEIASSLITPELGALDASLEKLRTSNALSLVSWMSGIQYFLLEDVPIVRGHVFFPDAPWGLTLISQAQFWHDEGLFRRRYGDGSVGGILSVDVCQWDVPGIGTAKSAKQCTPQEFADEVWLQMKLGLNGREPGDQVLRDELLHSWHLDTELDYSAGLPPRNATPLLVHPPGHWNIRPEAGTAVANLVLAADYVRTFTNLATMEGACEAARRATNVILDRSGSHAAPAGVWPMKEPAFFDSWKRFDDLLYRNGKPHVFDLMGIRNVDAAMDMLRRFRAVTGIETLDDILDQFQASKILRGILERFGL
jgi:15-cis-phytoene desaturase